jgi:hypothetical protein
MTVQQIATVVKELTLPDQRQLLDLVPNLRWVAQKRPVRTLEEARAEVSLLQEELMAELNYQPISGNEPFLGGFTLNQYLALPDSEQARIWDEAAEIDWDDLEEVEVSPDVLFAR